MDSVGALKVPCDLLRGSGATGVAWTFDNHCAMKQGNFIGANRYPGGRYIQIIQLAFHYSNGNLPPFCSCSSVTPHFASERGQFGGLPIELQ